MRGILCVIAALVVPVLTVHAEDEPDLAALRQSLIDVDIAFAKATAERGRDGWLLFFAEDAVLLPHNEPIVRGLKDIRSYYERNGFTGQGLTWKPAQAEVSAAGDLGYTYGTFENVTASPDGREQRRTGKYTTVWRRQEDGSWKLTLDIGSLDVHKRR